MNYLHEELLYLVDNCKYVCHNYKSETETTRDTWKYFAWLKKNTGSKTIVIIVNN